MCVAGQEEEGDFHGTDYIHMSPQLIICMKVLLEIFIVISLEACKFQLQSQSVRRWEGID